ncbi:MAG TPA: Crp/Fnr family transcriptional regulator [Cyclobacteriaceae bacterium]|nr:Crp/Fnr family transcriptional regulator [Cyclobacteriaceae bacterium]
MTSLEKYIKQSVSLSPDELRTILAFFKTSTLSKGEYFGKRGRYCEKLGFVQSGFIRVFIDANDREVTQWISGPGYFITDLSSFIFQTDGRWNMQALTDCVVHQITREDYEALAKKLPLWKEIDRLLIVKCFSLMEERILNHLYMSTEERFRYLQDTQPELFNLVPLQYLASMLGMTPETLSRLRRKQMKA